MPTNFPTTLDDFGTVPANQQTAIAHRERHQNVEDAVEALEAKVGVNGSAVTTSLDYKVAQFATSGGSAGVGFIQAGTGAVVRTAQAKMREWVSVADFGAVGDGVTSDQTAFNNALALAVPVYVPYTTSFYVLTSLTDANRALLWGPGRVKVSGSDVNITSEPRAFPNDTAGRAQVKANWQPAKWPTVDGSIGNGSVDDVLTRTGGFGTYGMDLKRLLVTAATPAGQFDVVDTSWAVHTNLTGGQLFGAWSGANTPARYLSQTYSGGAVIGHEFNAGNRWADFGLQTDVGGTRYTVGLQIAPDVLPAPDGDNTTAVSNITIASPGVFTVTGHGFTAGMGLVFTGDGTIPTGLTKGTVYYVLSSGLTADNFQVAATPGGAAINTTGSFVAPISVRPSWPGTFADVIGASVQGHRWWVGSLIRPNAIMPAGHGHYAWGGSVASQAPASWAKLAGFYQYGIDLNSASFSSAILNIPTSATSTTATGGAQTLPANPDGFTTIHVNGAPKKVPYYNA